MYNTGQLGGNGGFDINVLPVWQNLQITGTSVKAAVVDEGVDVTHHDLIYNMLGGMDATPHGSGGKYSGNDAHGTACAGIIAAQQDGQGVTGIAYNSKIVPIRLSYYDTAQYRYQALEQWVSSGLDYARYNADVVNFVGNFSTISTIPKCRQN